ncbi:MAG: DUF455 family protein [Elusimicrobia bacterium]|nr:DUF455 family protein [Elusimicrobiota bacterium]
MKIPPEIWSPFRVCPSGLRAPAPRPIDTPEGVADRLRSVAFAELQAREAFLWAAGRFAEAPEKLRKAWRALAKAEDRHCRWLLDRLRELGSPVEERPVSIHLWQSLVQCETPKRFAFYMAGSEERGRQAGELFRQKMAAADRLTSEIFGRIAREEVEHIKLAAKFF